MIYLDWNNINRDRDTSGLGPIEYDQSKVPALIRKYADNVRTKTYGQEVREAQARNAEIAGLIAHEAVDISNETKERQNDVETQFNSVQRELTDKDVISAPEIIAARNGEVNLKARIDKDHQEVTAQLAETNNVLKIGKVDLPQDFPKIPFVIYKKQKNVFAHNFKNENIHDFSNATEVFISDISSGGSELGATRDKPINALQFILRYKDGLYGSQKDFILNFIDDVYGFLWSGAHRFSDIDVNVLFKSTSPSGNTWIGRLRPPEETTTSWTPVSGNVYKYTVATSNGADYPVNLTQLDPFGVPLPYAQMASLEDCSNTEGSFFIDTSNQRDIYFHKFAYENINFVKIARKLEVLPVRANLSKMIFQDIGFLANTAVFDSKNIASRFAFSRCRFYRGNQDAFAMTGDYHVYLFDCFASYGSKDGFNYHATNPLSVAVEVNCFSTGNGKYKFINGNQDLASNNGSTAHDGMHMLRVGSQYSECEGPTVADIQNCYSISIGCGAYDLLGTTTGTKAAFYVQDDVATGNKPKYIIECTENGKNFTSGINCATAPKTYYQNFTGNHPLVGNPILIDWETVVS